MNQSYFRNVLVVSNHVPDPGATPAEEGRPAEAQLLETCL